MTRDDIIKLAREASLPSCLATHPVALERFAALVAAAEREACAKLADDTDPVWYSIGTAIRARGLA